MSTEFVPLETLGHGTRGEVRIAVYNGVHVVLKTFEPDETFVGTSDLFHPNVVRVLGRYFGDGKTTEVRELCEGGELFDHIAESGGLQGNLSLLVRWVKEICSALAYCHEKGAANGQFRPEQVLLDSHGSVKLLGFRLFQSEAAHLPRPSVLLDAPELHGRGWASVQELMVADMWAVGVLLLAMLTGLSQFGETASLRSKSVQSFSKHGLKAGRPDLVALVPPLLLPVLEATLQHEPAMRPSAKQLLEQILQDPELAKVLAFGDHPPATTSLTRASKRVMDECSCSPTGGGGDDSGESGSFKAARSSSSTEGDSIFESVSPHLRCSPLEAPGEQASYATLTVQTMLRPPTRPTPDVQTGSADGQEGTSALLLSPAQWKDSPLTSAAARLRLSPMPRPSTHVRCLGWDNLQKSFECLSSAVVESFKSLKVNYSATGMVGVHGWSFCAQPEYTAGTHDEMGLPLPSKGLIVSVWVFAAEEGCTTKHHVNLRRTQARDSRH